MREQDITQTEALKMNHLSIEEVAERRAELAKMRELMFRAEAKAKRVSKIKSKTYRRIKKKEKAKIAAKLGELDEDHEDDEESRLKREVERARERATLRHKNTGKWAKAMKARGELDVDQRREINEMLDRGEKLRRRIQGQGSDESDDEDDDSEDEGGVERIKASAFDELQQLKRSDEDVPGAIENKRKGVFEMKFMKNAMARDQHSAEQIVDDFIKELGGRIPEEDDVVGTDDTSRPPDGASRVGGRMSFRPGNVVRPIVYKFRIIAEIPCVAGTFSLSPFARFRHLQCYPQVYRRRGLQPTHFSCYDLSYCVPSRLSAGRAAESMVSPSGRWF